MKIILSMLLLVMGTGLTAQRNNDLQKDLDKLPGNWEGHLTYTDYKDDKTNVQLPAAVTIKRSADALAIDYTYTEPNGKQMKNPGDLKIIRDSSTAVFNGQAYDIVAVHRKGMRLTIVLEREGDDNDRPSAIRQSITISEGVLNILKEVKYQGTDKFFVRNRLTLRKL